MKKEKTKDPGLGSVGRAGLEEHEEGAERGLERQSEREREVRTGTRSAEAFPGAPSEGACRDSWPRLSGLGVGNT